LVQGVERVGRELVEAGALVGHLVAGGGVFVFLAAHRRGVFEGLFASGRGGGRSRRR
jgi:hypothetical protein